MNHHTSENQEICRKLVKREVICCVSTLVSELAPKADQFQGYAEDLYNAFVGVINIDDAASDYFGNLGKDTLEEIAEARDISFDPNSHSADIEALIINDIRDNEGLEEYLREEQIELDDYSREVFEHWVISDWLGDKLEAHGEKVLRNFFGFDAIWCRTTTGQAILLDGVIGDIAEEMEILKGQANDWSSRA